MAGMIFKQDPFFKGNDNFDQLIKIAKIMGTEDLSMYLKKYKLSLPGQVTKVIKNYPKIAFEELINKSNQHLVNDLALDLLRQFLVYDKNLRITPFDAMKHPYFDIVRHTILSE